jgi:RNA polymerase sigma-70 factor, ECF subfamily
MPLPDDATAAFEPLRPRLFRIAYGMLGSVADAEDAVQNAYLRWRRAERTEVRSAEAYLVRTVTRLCLDVLKSARRHRETYLGPWLPEPVVEPEEEVADDITVALMLALERLSPLERAAFLLHDVFGLAHGEVATTLDRDAAACRQLATRARGHVHAARPRYPVADDHAKEIAEAFFEASRSGELEALRALLAADVAMYADGGGKVQAIPRPLLGREDVAAFFVALAEKAGDRQPVPLYAGRINGLPGFVVRAADGVVQTMALEIEGNAVVGIYVVRNPDKLRHLGAFGGSSVPPSG